MKITRISIGNYLGARDVDVVLRTPVALFAGANHSGKSSIREAVVHALTGASSRGSGLKKDLSALVYDGAKAGCAIVETDSGRAAITLPTGKHESAFVAPSALPYVLDAQRFASLDQNGRRSFLLDLTGVQMTGKSVVDRLLANGYSDEIVSSIEPYLVAGIESAHKEAQGRARDAKAAWREVTGETYGAQKALIWAAPRVSWDEKKLKHAQAALQETEGALSRATEELGAMRSRVESDRARSAKAAGLRQSAGQYARFAAKLETDKKSLAEWEIKVSETESAASGVKGPKPMSCPECGAMVAIENRALVPYIKPDHEPDPEAAEKLETYRQARDLMRRSVENDQKQVDAADSAARALAALEDGEQPNPVTDGDLNAHSKRVSELHQQRDAMRDEVSAIESSKRLAESAEMRTDKARVHHHTVAAWESIAAALAPGGIQAELLRDAIAPINARLEQSAEVSGWLIARIDEDMTIRAGRRDYRLLSESERYRVDAMIAEAIASESGIRLLVLDRIDVLDPAGRMDLIDWVDTLADEGQVESVLLFATLKGRPDIDRESTESFWIENGVVV